MIDLIITGVVDGDLPGGQPKAVELYVVNDISDLSVYGFGSANNGEGSDGQEYTFSGSARAGDYLYIASETEGFTSFFGFAPTDTAAAININGDDAIELFKNGIIVDTFGDPDLDGTGEPWEYSDGWAYRQTFADVGGTFNRSQWQFSVPGALDGATDNRLAVTPFPVGAFSVESEPVAETPDDSAPDMDSEDDEAPESATPESATPENDESESDHTTLTLIHEIQGSAVSSPLVGESVTIEAVVVGDFQGEEGLQGFYLQEEDAQADGDDLTSEGIFVFDEDFGVDVVVGDLVRVSGTVAERFDNLTALTRVTEVDKVRTAPLPTPATLNFPLLDQAIALEAAEGMLVTIPETLYVTEYFNLDRFGELRLSSDGPGNAPGTDGRLDQYTQFNEPSVEGLAEYRRAITPRQITLDDGSSQQTPGTLIFGRGGQPLSATNPLRGGDTITGLTGILSYDFNSFRIHNNQGVDLQPTNPRPEQPADVGGRLKLASLNVLNFFTTIDQAGNAGSGPNRLPPRGADSDAEFERQLEKLVTALATIDADIVGLVELENEFADTNGDSQVAVEVLVDALNERVGADTYTFVSPQASFVDTGDAISVGAIYKTATVRIAPGTTVETLTDEDIPALNLDISEPIFDGSSTNRASLAITFEEIGSGEAFTVAVNHFKSKGGSGSGDNADINDGQGNFNGTRVRGAQALATWLEGDPTGSNDDDFLIIGDLNAYAQEDPIEALEEAGYVDLAAQFLGSSAYSFVFDGQVGTLDYAMANPSLQGQITGTTEWHINADEPDAIDYNLDFERDSALFDGRQPYRTSDHDPIVVGISLGSGS